MAEPHQVQEPPATEPASRPPAGPGRRLGLLALGAAAAATLAAAVVVGPGEWRVFQQRNTRLVPPAETAGLRLDNSPEAQSTADYLRTALAAGMDLKSTVSTVYADPASPSRSVIFVGGTATLRRPETDLDRLFELVTDETNGVARTRVMPAGPLGGVVKCGTSAADGDELAICGWADNGSVAVAMFPGRTVDDSAELLRTMRGDIEKRP